MSIFKSTLKPYVAAQLKAREKIISQIGENGLVGSGFRDNDFLKYTTGKNGWVRMISLVNYESQGFVNEKEGVGKFKADGRYTGNNLSKKYVLEGGTLFNKGENFSLRRGINQVDGIYGSDIDRISSNPSIKGVDRTYGLRPMPGITSVQINNKSAYGSLREATVSFYAWDKHQLEELEVLFMRPGYSVFLDWGWSMYLNHDPNGKNGLNSYPDNISIKNFDVLTPDVFNNIKETDLYNIIDNSIEKNLGNYDAMLGFVKNFSWQLMPNGGFNCTTTLISRGEVMEGLKASNNPRTIIGSPQVNTNPDDAKPVFSFFEKIFLTLKGIINKSEFSSFNQPPKPSAPPDGETPTPTPTPPTPTNTTEFYDANANMSTIIDSIDDKWKSIKQALEEKTFIYEVYDDVKGSYTIRDYGYPLPTNIGAVLPTQGTTDGSGIEYLSMNTFIAILQRFFIPRDKNTLEPLVKIVIPYNTPCLMSEDTVSVDPTTCLIRNNFATFVMDNTEGFDPVLYTSLTFLNETLSTGSRKELPTFVKESPSHPKSRSADVPKLSNPKEKETINYNIVNVGEIGNIYIAVGKIIQTYRDLAGGENGVNIIDFLQKLLDDISYSLGGINDFKLWTDKNKVQIIDAKYLEGTNDPNGGSSQKFQLNLIGLKSICRDVQISSKIFSEQSTMIGIGAASPGGDVNNLGDIYSSTQNLLNKGLKDRLIKDLEYSSNSGTEKVTIGSTNISGDNLYYIDIYNNIVSLTNYLKRKVIGSTSVETLGYNSITAPDEVEIQNASGLLKSLHYQLNGKDVDFKAMIPFELEITLDGIAGLVVGQIFTISKDFLPKDYYNKNLGFIITGISHTIQNNDWTTNVKTQICLLDNERYAPNVDKFKLKQAITAVKKAIETVAYLHYAMTDYLVYLTLKIIDIKDHEKYPFIEGNSKLQNEVTAFTDDESNNTDLDHWNWDYAQIINYLFSPKEDINNDALKFDRGMNNKNSYLYKWWEKSKDKGLQNFPQTFEEFYTLKLPFDNQEVKMDALISKFENNFVYNSSKTLTVQGSSKEYFNVFTDFGDNDLFLTRFFGPKGKVKETIQSLGLIDNVTNDAEFIVKILKLRELWTFILDKLDTDFQTQSNYKILVNARAVILNSCESVQDKTVDLTTGRAELLKLLDEYSKLNFKAFTNNPLFAAGFYTNKYVKNNVVVERDFPWSSY